MDAVPSLCASATLGVAAIGYAFGRIPHSSTDSRPSSNKRKTPDGEHDPPFNPYTPERPPYTHSPSTSQRPTPTSSRRPQSATVPRNSSQFINTFTINESPDEKEDWRASLFGQASVGGSSKGSDVADVGAGTAKSSWLRRMSTISTSTHGSRISTPQPSTPSISFSNASGAPFLPPNSTLTTSRNKLVKRSSSQRGLHNHDQHSSTNQVSFMPTLRRPATSHQRSAKLQQQTFQEMSGYEEDPSHPMDRDLPRSISSDKQDVVDASTQVWWPLFRTKTVKFAKETPARPATQSKVSGRNDYIKCITPVQGERPTLMLATSITRPVTHHSFNPPQTLVTSTSPSLSELVQTPPMPTANGTAIGSKGEDQTAKRSFSIGDMFSAPAASSWKMARAGSLRRKKRQDGPNSGRRVASEPQALQNRKRPGNIRISNPSVHSAGRPNSSHDSSHHANRPYINHTMRSPSSPLPPLNRMSTFDMTLPDKGTSFPSSPMSNIHPNSVLQSNSSPIISPNHLIQQIRIRPNRSSTAPSDRASTLFGSDNESNRVFTVDGDEMDFRSDTVWDSVRTGATGSSHSGAPGPRIETVFDEANPAEVAKQNLAALQEKLSNVSISVPQSKFIAEEESMRTPIGARQTYSPRLTLPSPHLNKLSPTNNFNSSPPLTLAMRSSGQFDCEDANMDDVWSLTEVENQAWGQDGLHESGSDKYLTTVDSSQLLTSPIYNELSSGKPSSESDRPKSNIFEWSERQSVDRDATDGESPRPKTVHGKQVTERSRASGRRGPSALHMRSQSVPLPPDGTNHRANTSKLDAWMLGGKGVSEDWDGDFEFDESPTSAEATADHSSRAEANLSLGVVVPPSILERQASVHGQFGQVKELTLLVEELKRLRHQAIMYGILHGRSSELWKEAEGIINLATLDDDDQDFLSPRSTTPELEYDPFEDDFPAPSRRHRSTLSPAPEEGTSTQETNPTAANPSPPSSQALRFETPPRSRTRADSTAQAKSVLETIHNQRNDPTAPQILTPEPKNKPNPKPEHQIQHQHPHPKTPFDTTSLRDLVTRAGVVTRALKDIIRRANESDPTTTTTTATATEPDSDSDAPHHTHSHTHMPKPPPDPAFSHIFFHPGSSPPPAAATSRSPRQRPNSNPAGPAAGGYLGAPLVGGNDNELLMMMTVV